MTPIRTPLLEFQKKLAFYGGPLNTHTPRDAAWLPKRLRGTHTDGLVRSGPRGKLGRRAGDPLRDEPLRHDLERMSKLRHKHSHIHSDVNLIRTDLLLDHHKPT